MWKCPNVQCIEHGVVKPLGPGNMLTTWTCKACKTVLVPGGRR